MLKLNIASGCIKIAMTLLCVIHTNDVGLSRFVAELHTHTHIRADKA